MSGSASGSQQLVDAERDKARMAERMADNAMGNMKDVSSTYRSQTAAPPRRMQTAGVVQRCANCSRM
jgi:hypothetical protein